MSEKHLEDLLSDPDQTRDSLRTKIFPFADGLWPTDLEYPESKTYLEFALGDGENFRQKFIENAVDFADELEGGRLERKSGGKNIILSISCGRSHVDVEKARENAESKHVKRKNGKHHSPDKIKSSEDVAGDAWDRNFSLVLQILMEDLALNERVFRVLLLETDKFKPSTPPKKRAEENCVDQPDTPRDLPWCAVPISCCDVILHLFRNKGALPTDMQGNFGGIANFDLINSFIQQIKTKECMMTTTAMTYSIYMCVKHYRTSAMSFLFGGTGVPEFAEFLNKEYAVKNMIQWWKSKKSPHPWEKTALYNRWWVYSMQSSNPRQDLYNLEETEANTKELLVRWGRGIIANCAHTLAMAVEGAVESVSITLLRNKTLIKGMMFWFRSPMIVLEDMEIIQGCSRLIANMLVTETIALYFIKDHHIINDLEHLVLCPSAKNLTEYLHIIERLTTFPGICRDFIAKAKGIVKALLRYCGSYEKEIALHAVKATTNLLSGQTAKFVIESGFNIRQLIIWNDYNFYHELCFEWGKMKTAVKGAGVREWYQQETRLKGNKSMSTNSYDEDQAATNKERGNIAYKRQEYKKAISYYTEALKLSPPSRQTVPCVCLHYEKVGECRGHKCRCTYELWSPLTAQLWSNKAQCFLHLGKYQEALDCCDQAVAKCLEDTDEAKDLLQKSLYRRTKALLELGDLKRALTDAGLYHIREKGKGINSQLFDEVYFRYRQEHGNHLIRRCCVCLRGEGEKLKRCVNCDELYCSKECQASDWQRRHKESCKKNKKNKEDEGLNGIDAAGSL